MILSNVSCSYHYLLTARPALLIITFWHAPGGYAEVAVAGEQF